MIVWGISANSHDAALSVFVDDELVFASHSERFSGIKNDRDLCTSLVEYAERWGKPEKIFWYENPYLKTARQLLAGQGWNWKKNNIKKYLQRWGISAPITYTNHHKSHAAAGFYTSKFDESCIIVIDSIGEFETLTIWDANISKFKKLYSLTYPSSIGLWYSAMTQRLGLKPNEDEYILMGMSAYGDKTLFVDKLKSDFFKDIKKLSFSKSLHRGCMDWEPTIPVSQYFDVAAGVQNIYEELLQTILSKASSLSQSKNLILMGGCALNCLANRHIGKYFNNIWIMPNPGDAGSSIGAVLAHTKRKIDWEHSYLGYDMGNTTDNQQIVDYLLTHKICGLARGKAEFGPRALGNRSIIADPRGKEIKDKVNEIKQRQEFRPFAPAILEEYADQYFDMPLYWNNSRYMQTVATCRYPDEYPAIVHRDGTSRVQTVPNDGSEFRRLLELWFNQTGCPMLLNTSLNIKGNPMVNNHADAIQFENLYNVKVFT